MALTISTTPKNREMKHLMEIIQQTTIAVVENRNNSNKIVDVLSTFLTQNDRVVIAAINCVNKIFSYFIQNDLMYLDRAPSQEEHLERSVEEKYRLWLWERYQDTLEQLHKCLASENEEIQKLALSTLMNFIADEGSHPLTPIEEHKSSFPMDKLTEVLKQFLSSDNDMKQVIAKFEEYLQYDDVKYNVIKSLLKILRSTDTESASTTLVWNIFTLLSLISLPEQNKKHPPSETGHNICTSAEGNNSGFKFTYEAVAKSFSLLWLEFLKFKLPHAMYIKVLAKLPYKVMPHMPNPLGLTDFLSESYNIGGTASILSLQGIFMLMQKCNLEYPDFYKKLYGLFEPHVLYAKYRARLFFWADIFLTSTHLPAYLVAAFAKRISRLALQAPTHVLQMMIPFIRNLFIRHPSLKVLIDRPDAQSIEADPFIMEEPDPAKCRALESSLWELKTLQSHWYHKVVKEANFINIPIPEIETDLGDLLEITPGELIEEETNKKIKIASVSTKKPSGLFHIDLLPNAWVLN